MCNVARSCVSIGSVDGRKVPTRKLAECKQTIRRIQAATGCQLQLELVLQIHEGHGVGHVAEGREASSAVVWFQKKKNFYVKNLMQKANTDFKTCFDVKFPTQRATAALLPTLALTRKCKKMSCLKAGLLTIPKFYKKKLS